MTDKLEKLTIQRVTRERKQDTEDIVVKELPVTITLNNQELATLLCYPADLEYLAIGFLFSEGLLNSKAEIEKVTTDNQKGMVYVETKQSKESPGEFLFKRLITSGCGRGISFYRAADAEALVEVKSKATISAPEVFYLAKEFQNRSQLYRMTGGVHSAALCDTKSILVFNEDIGRHNAIDKVLGECIWRDIPVDDRVVITSGRISSDILLKITRRNIPILISKSAPTNMSVKLAGDLGVTLIGFVRGGRMNVYTNGWRVTTDGYAVEPG